jgi:hypothetical protein
MKTIGHSESFRNTIHGGKGLMIFRLFRVPGVYLTWANPVFLAFFSFNRINNLRVFSVAFSSIPTAPTKSFLFRAF